MSLTGKATAKKLRGKINGLETLKGYSAYEIALIHGFEGTEEEWLASLQGEQGEQGEKGESTKVVITRQTVESINGTVVTIVTQDIVNGKPATKSDQFVVYNGKDGDKGDDGYTPVKGVDYYTEADKEALIKEIDTSLLGDIESALDGIISIQNELMGISTVTIYKTTDHTGDKSEYLYKPGMTWAEWVASEYNVDGYYVDDSGTLCNSDGTYIGYGGLEEGEIVVTESLDASAIIDPNTYLYCYD